MVTRSTFIVLAAASALAIPQGLLAYGDKPSSQNVRSTPASASQSRPQNARPSTTTRKAKQDRLSGTRAYLAKKYGTRKASRQPR